MKRHNLVWLVFFVVLSENFILWKLFHRNNSCFRVCFILSFDGIKMKHTYFYTKDVWLCKNQPQMIRKKRIPWINMLFDLFEKTEAHIVILFFGFFFLFFLLLFFLGSGGNWSNCGSGSSEFRWILLNENEQKIRKPSIIPSVQRVYKKIDIEKTRRGWVFLTLMYSLMVVASLNSTSVVAANASKFLKPLAMLCGADANVG